MHDAEEQSIARAILEAKSGRFRNARRYALATVMLLGVLVATMLIMNLPCVGCAAAPTAAPAACPAGYTCTTPPPTVAAAGSTWPSLVVGISALASIVSALATVSSVILAWRKEQREVADFRRRLDELEAARQRAPR